MAADQFNDDDGGPMGFGDDEDGGAMGFVDATEVRIHSFPLCLHGMRMGVSRDHHHHHCLPQLPSSFHLLAQKNN